MQYQLPLYVEPVEIFQNLLMYINRESMERWVIMGYIVLIMVSEKTLLYLKMSRNHCIAGHTIENVF